MQTELAQLEVECLGCGATRNVVRVGHEIEPGECPRCGYLGWADPTSLSEQSRRALRERPPATRKIFALHLY
jgi:hypothetical protein